MARIKKISEYVEEQNNGYTSIQLLTDNTIMLVQGGNCHCWCWGTILARVYYRGITINSHECDYFCRPAEMWSCDRCKDNYCLY